MSLGGLLLGAMAFFVQGRVFGFENITITAIAPPVIVGAVVGAIISFLIRRGQNKLREANDHLARDVASQTAELRRSEEKFRAIFDHSFAAIVTVDNNGAFTTWNDAFVDLLGYDNEALKTVGFRDISHPDDLDVSKRQMARIFKGEIDFFRIEKRWIRRSGMICWGEISVAPLRSTAGEIIGAIANIVDISDRKAAEMEIASSEKRLRAILQSCPYGVGVSRVKDGIIEYVNDKNAELFGETVQNMIGSSATDLWADPQDRARFLDIFRRDGRVPGTEVRMKRFDGSEFWTITSWDNISFFGEDTVLFWVNDISDRKQASMDLERAKNDAEKANRVKSEFLSSMSHELRTPMNAILGFGQLLASNPEEPLSEEQAFALDHIMHGGEHLLELIDQVLDLAKIEAGQLTITIKPVHLNELCLECLALVESLAEKRELAIECDLGAPSFIMADEVRFKQALLNLLSNAIKYSHESGSVTLSCREVTGNKMRVSVGDSGEGISEIAREGLFEPFNRLGKEGSDIEGTGVGLTIARQLIEGMGGRIGVESEIGSGSEFWIEIPVIESAAALLEAAAPVNNARLSEAQPAMRGTILYVEDNSANLELMEAIIDRMEGLNLVSAYSAEQGIEMAIAQQPDLILMDINLPGMDGIAAKKILDGIDLLKNIPVVGISANAMKSDIDKGMAAGFKAYLSKPFNVPEVIAVLKKELEV